MSLIFAVKSEDAQSITDSPEANGFDSQSNRVNDVFHFVLIHFFLRTRLMRHLAYMCKAKLPWAERGAVNILRD